MFCKIMSKNLSVLYPTVTVCQSGEIIITQQEIIIEIASWKVCAYDFYSQVEKY